MKIEVNIEKKYVFLILGVILLIGGAIFVYAYKANPTATSGNPAVFGHSVDEIDWLQPIYGSPILGGVRNWIFYNRNTGDVGSQPGDGLWGDNNVFLIPYNNSGTGWDLNKAVILKRGDVCLANGKCLSQVQQKIRWDKWVAGSCTGGAGTLACNSGWIVCGTGHWTSSHGNEPTWVKCCRVDPTFSNPAMTGSGCSPTFTNSSSPYTG